MEHSFSLWELRAYGRALPRAQGTALHRDHRPIPLWLRSSRLSKCREGCPDRTGLRSQCPARLAPDLASDHNVLSCPRKGPADGVAAASTRRILPGATGELQLTVPRSAPGFSSVVKPRPHGLSNPDPASPFLITTSGPLPEVAQWSQIRSPRGRGGAAAKLDRSRFPRLPDPL